MKIRMKYVNQYRDRANGKTFYYYRRAGQRVRLPDNPLSKDFRLAYEKLVAQFDTTNKATDPRSFKSLVVAYQASHDFKKLKPASRKSYDRALAQIVEFHGHEIASEMPRSFVVALRDSMTDRPRAANNTLTVLRLVMSWGLERDWMASNPAVGVKPLTYQKSPHVAWSSLDVERVIEAKTTTPSIRLAIMLGLYTGQRIGDVCKMRWSDYEKGEIVVRQQKTGEPLLIPVHERLRAALTDAPRRAVTILATDVNGVPLKPDRLQHRLKDACVAVGLTDRTFHGLRKSAAVALWEAGCDPDDIMAVTGHKTEAMLRHYLKDAKQAARARAAIRKWESKQ